MNVSDNITQSSFSCVPVVPDSDLVRIVKIMSILLVGGFAVFGNTLIIFLAGRFQVKRNIHHLIINMAVSDILVVIIFSYYHIPSLLGLPNLWELWDNDVFANISCKAYYFFGYTCPSVTLTTLLIISVERFRSTKVTVHRARPYTLKKRLALVSCSWLIPMGLSAYSAWYYKIIDIYDTRFCWSPKTNLLLLSTLHRICILLMVCLVVIFNIMTSFRLWKSRRTFLQGDISNEQNRTREKRTAKAVKMVLYSLLLYTCCYLPDFLFHVLESFAMSGVILALQPYFQCTSEWRTLHFFLYFLYLVNSFFSPCIYIVFLTEFRQAAKRLLY